LHRHEIRLNATNFFGPLSRAGWELIPLYIRHKVGHLNKQAA
jgi:hypothetical protein